MLKASQIESFICLKENLVFVPYLKQDSCVQDLQGKLDSVPHTLALGSITKGFSYLCQFVMMKFAMIIWDLCVRRNKNEDVLLLLLLKVT